MFRRAISIFIFLCCFQSAFSQWNSILENFTVINTNGKTYLNWTITSGSTCNGIQIYRSTDGIQFTEIGNIAGICGSSSTPTTYNYIDANAVKNRINYYRLELGGNGKSEIVSLEILDITGEGYQIRPNPISANSKIYFDNEKKQLHHLILYTLTGLFTLTISTKEDFFIINATTLPGGNYLFTILNEYDILKVRGKILVQH